MRDLDSPFSVGCGSAAASSVLPNELTAPYGVYVFHHPVSPEVQRSPRSPQFQCDTRAHCGIDVSFPSQVSFAMMVSVLSICQISHFIVEGGGLGPPAHLSSSENRRSPYSKLPVCSFIPAFPSVSRPLAVPLFCRRLSWLVFRGVDRATTECGGHRSCLSTPLVSC